eukprot:scaffold12007_cov20-Tisochrysis_lutea.AAC.1
MQAPTCTLPRCPTVPGPCPQWCSPLPPEPALLRACPRGGSAVARGRQTNRGWAWELQHHVQPPPQCRSSLLFLQFMT